MTLDLSTIITLVTILAGGSGIAGIIVALSTKKKSKADAIKVIEEATSSLIQHYKEDNESVRKECSELKVEVETLTCRLDNDVEECRREIEGLRHEVATLKIKNGKLIDALNRLIYQIKSKGETPVIKAEDYWAE